MRTLLIVSFLISFVSCSSSPEQQLDIIKNEWIKKDTVQLSEERLQKRIEKSLQYVASNREYWGFPLKGCEEVATDTLREKKKKFRIATTPTIGSISGVDADVAYTLREIMSCEVYGQPFDSLLTQISPNRRQYSEQNNLLVAYSNATMDSVANWRENNIEALKEKTLSIIEKLPSDEESDDALIFEVPTGKTIRIHLPAFHPVQKSNWDILKYQPEQIISKTYASDHAIIFFNDKDDIEKVWWGGYIE